MVQFELAIDLVFPEMLEIINMYHLLGNLGVEIKLL